MILIQACDSLLVSRMQCIKINQGRVFVSRREFQWDRCDKFKTAGITPSTQSSCRSFFILNYEYTVLFLFHILITSFRFSLMYPIAWLKWLIIIKLLDFNAIEFFCFFKFLSTIFYFQYRFFSFLYWRSCTAKKRCIATNSCHKQCVLFSFIDVNVRKL